jgi:hypothetical protein
MTNKNDGINRPPRQDNKNKSEDKMSVIQRYEKTVNYLRENLHINSEALFDQTNDPNPHIPCPKMTQGQLNQLILHDLMQDTHCFEIPPEVYNVTRDFVDDKLLKHSDQILDEEYRPLADKMFVTFVTQSIPDNMLSFWITQTEPNMYEFHYVHKDGKMSDMGQVRIGGANIWYPSGKIGIPEEEAQANLTWEKNMIPHVLTTIAAIKNTNFVKYEPAGTRQQRKSAHRGMGMAMDAWHRVTWNIDDAKKAKVPYDEGYHKMPLHWNRGHWKRAKEHHPKSQQRPHALNAEDRNMWWTWVDGYWAGHPAFGFKKQYHAPKLKVN